MTKSITARKVNGPVPKNGEKKKAAPKKTAARIPPVTKKTSGRKTAAADKPETSQRKTAARSGSSARTGKAPVKKSATKAVSPKPAVTQAAAAHTRQSTSSKVSPKVALPLTTEKPAQKAPARKTSRSAVKIKTASKSAVKKPVKRGAGSKKVTRRSLGLSKKTLGKVSIADDMGSGTLDVERVESSKYTLTATTDFQEPSVGAYPARELDDLYDETRLTLLVRDPEWIFAYWDIDTETRRRLGIPRGGHNRRLLIRWYDVTDLADFDGHNAHRTMDIEISDAARSWYQKMPETNRHWCAELGILDEAGRFVGICRSGYVQTPRFDIAPPTPDGGEWMFVEQARSVSTQGLPQRRLVQPAHLVTEPGRLPVSAFNALSGGSSEDVPGAGPAPEAPPRPLDVRPVEGAGASESFGGVSEGLGHSPSGEKPLK